MIALKKKKKTKKKKVAKKIETEFDKMLKKYGINDLTYSLFYAFSFGNFYEEIDGVSAESSQNSPFTIGASLNFKFKKDFAYSGSAYFSQLNSAISTSTEISSVDKKADIPWEYGFTSYVGLMGFNQKLSHTQGLIMKVFLHSTRMSLKLIQL